MQSLAASIPQHLSARFYRKSLEPVKVNENASGHPAT
jgi:hypothetical protein